VLPFAFSLPVTLPTLFGVVGYHFAPDAFGNHIPVLHSAPQVSPAAGSCGYHATRCLPKIFSRSLVLMMKKSKLTDQISLRNLTCLLRPFSCPQVTVPSDGSPPIPVYSPRLLPECNRESPLAHLGLDYSVCLPLSALGSTTLVTHFYSICSAYLREGNLLSYSKLPWALWALIVALFLFGLTIGFVMNSLDDKWYKRHLQFLRLEFDTRLGMHSPR